MITYSQEVKVLPDLWVSNNQSEIRDVKTFEIFDNADLILDHNSKWVDDQISAGSVFVKDHKTKILESKIPEISDDLDIEIW